MTVNSKYLSLLTLADQGHVGRIMLQLLPEMENVLKKISTITIAQLNMFNILVMLKLKS